MDLYQYLYPAIHGSIHHSDMRPSVGFADMACVAWFPEPCPVTVIRPCPGRVLDMQIWQCFDSFLIIFACKSGG